MNTLETKIDILISLAQIKDVVQKLPTIPHGISYDDIMYLGSAATVVKNRFERRSACTCASCYANNRAWEHLTTAINRLEKTL